MDRMLPIVKFLTEAQIVIIILFLIIMYLIKFHHYLLDKKNIERAKVVTKLLDSHFKKKEAFTKKSISLLKKSIHFVLKDLEELAKRESSSEYLPTFNAQLSELVLKPIARKWTFSKAWEKRFEATICYLYGFDPDDETCLIKLLHDPSMLITMKAAEVVIKYNHPTLINEMITIFSKGRRLQQSLTIDSIAKQSVNISPTIIERLQKEKNIYTKVFCYRLLSLLPQSPLASCYKKDITYDSVDLKIAILTYLAHFEDEEITKIIYSLANEPDWEIRAAVAKVLGKIHTQKSLELLTEMLHSSDWWVRQNVALSLYQQGNQGIKILKGQSLEEDKFAYEAAQAVLIERGKLC